jgi:hypothetical protein
LNRLPGFSALTRFRDQLLWASNYYVDTLVAMSTVRTRPWPDLLAELVEQDPTSPYLPLVRFIAQSDFSNELHGGLFLSGLHLSDSPDFKLGVNMLRVQGLDTDQFKISYFRGRGGFKDDAEKICGGEELVAAVALFVKVKFGIVLSLRRANG